MSIGKTKNILGNPKTDKIKLRAAVLMELTGKSLNSLGKEAGISNGTPDDWSDNQIEKPTRTVSDFLKHHKISEHWWKTGEGEPFIAGVRNSGSNNETPDPDKVLRHLVEGKGEYILINKELILDKYRLVSLEQIEEEKKESQRKHEEILRDLEDRKNQIHGLYQIITEITKKLPDSGSVTELKKA